MKDYGIRSVASAAVAALLFSTGEAQLLPFAGKFASAKEGISQALPLKLESVLPQISQQNAVSGVSSLLSNEKLGGLSNLNGLPIVGGMTSASWNPVDKVKNFNLPKMEKLQEAIPDPSSLKSMNVVGKLSDVVNVSNFQNAKLLQNQQLQMLEGVQNLRAPLKPLNWTGKLPTNSDWKSMLPLDVDWRKYLPSDFAWEKFLPQSFDWKSYLPSVFDAGFFKAPFWNKFLLESLDWDKLKFDFADLDWNNKLQIPNVPAGFTLKSYLQEIFNKAKLENPSFDWQSYLKPDLDLESYIPNDVDIKQIMPVNFDWRKELPLSKDWRMYVPDNLDWKNVLQLELIDDLPSSLKWKSLVPEDLPKNFEWQKFFVWMLRWKELFPEDFSWKEYLPLEKSWISLKPYLSGLNSIDWDTYIPEEFGWMHYNDKVKQMFNELIGKFPSGMESVYEFLSKFYGLMDWNKSLFTNELALKQLTEEKRVLSILDFLDKTPQTFNGSAKELNADFLKQFAKSWF